MSRGYIQVLPNSPEFMVNVESHYMSHFGEAEGTFYRFGEMVIPHEDSCQAGGLFYYFWSISCLS